MGDIHGSNHFNSSTEGVSQVHRERGCQSRKSLLEAEEHCNGVLGLSAFSPVNGRLAVDNNNLAEA